MRAAPELAVWFRQDVQGVAHAVALSSEVVRSTASELLEGDIDRTEADWVVRVIVSLLANPAASDEEERKIVERFVVDPLMGTGGDRPGRTR